MKIVFCDLPRIKNREARAYSLAMLRLLAPLGIAAVLAASEAQPHDHQGKLTPYQIGPPSLLLSSSDEARLQSGKAVMQAIVSDDAQSRRLIMVQDIPAPSSIVMGSAACNPPKHAHPSRCPSDDLCATRCAVCQSYRRPEPL